MKKYRFITFLVLLVLVLANLTTRFTGLALGNIMLIAGYTTCEINHALRKLLGEEE